jgi:hypothetical protein
MKLYRLTIGHKEIAIVRARSAYQALNQTPERYRGEIVYAEEL